MNSPRLSVLVCSLRLTPPRNSTVICTPTRGSLLPPMTLPLIIVDCARAAGTEATSSAIASPVIRVTNWVFIMVMPRSLILSGPEKARHRGRVECDRGGWERVEEPPAIVHGPQPWIEHGQDTAVVAMTDEPA